MPDVIGMVGRAILEVVLPSAVTVLTGLVMAWVHKLAKKKDIEISEKNDARIRQIVTDLIRAAEEMAHRASKNDAQITGAAKKDFVVEETLKKIAADPTLPKLSSEKVETVIDSQLPIERPVKVVTFGPDPTLPGGGRR